MSRRKQARPSRHLDELSSGDEETGKARKRERSARDRVSEEEKSAEEQGRKKVKQEDGDRKINGIRNKNNSTHHRSRVFHHHNTLHSSDDETEYESRGNERNNATPLRNRHHQHAKENIQSQNTDLRDTEDANNNDPDADKDAAVEHQLALKESMTAAIENLIGTWPTTLGIANQDAIPAVTLEALQNTKIAMAQFAANALNAVSTGKEEPENPMQDLALLQSTLITLQQQQLLQIQLIQQLEQQCEAAAAAAAGESEKREKKEKKPEDNETQNGSHDKKSCTLSPHFASLLNCGNQDPNRPLSPGLPPQAFLMSMHAEKRNVKSTPSQENDPMAMMSNMLLPPPPVNTLEVLQKRAQEVLDSASQGLLASSLAADDPRKKGCYDKSREPFFKHRCRYCGKVFGSDSALQIHIRSHTGERPFKCNVCGSRFTTKGNLKVHFQRHAAKFPHIKMNPHPVPEQFDHLHPPLLTPGQTSPPDLSPSLPNHFPLFGAHPFERITGGPPPPMPGTTQLQVERDRYEESINKCLSEQECSPKERDSGQGEGEAGLLVRSMMMMMRDKPNKVTNVSTNHVDDQDEDDDEQQDREEETQPFHFHGNNRPSQHNQDLLPESQQRDNSQHEQPSPNFTSNNSFLNEHHNNTNRNTRGGSIGKQPAQISHAHPPDRPHSASTFLRTPPNQDLRLMTSSESPESCYSDASPSKSPKHPSDITKDPAIYTNLLPRPGSNDNAWESLIEVTKTSETSKLQQLVDNIEHKLTDPNQCIICHRVLSCKSALQMHYRTHTGERPFKCKICGRAFTTKGNLKTHMGVHRAKPPLRVLHQCPVCHKRFTNSLVLQQHIRLHTGEPTDLTPDQIRAAEVKDHYLLTPSSTSSTPSPGSFPNAQGLYGSPSGKHHDLDSDLDDDDEVCEDVNDDMLSDNDSKSITSNTNPHASAAAAAAAAISFSTSLAALENQVKTITTLANNQNMLMMIGGSGERPDIKPNLAPEDLSSKRTYDDESSNDSYGKKEPNNAALDLTGGKSSPAANTHTRLTASSPLQSIPIPMLPFGGGLPPPPPHLLFNNSLLIPPPPPPPPPGSAAAVAVAAAMERARLGDGGCFLWSNAGPGAIARGNTTCSICLKTFACHSALEIHYRSHTKERPFKCTVCDRGFSTKGNMKQHMLTHKIRDMPSSSSSSSSTKLDTTPPPNNHSVDSDDDNSSRAGDRSPYGDENYEMEEEINRKREIREKHEAMQLQQQINEEDDRSQDVVSESAEPRSPAPQPPPEPRMPTSAPTPPQQQSSGPRDESLKHVCRVCTKNFSSTSALQIHMRTHTGDRPFVCSVCQKAFTTKGNLKVHMGTHMWTNGASRRGRRMSLDMPLGLAAAVQAAAAQGTAPLPHHFFAGAFAPPPPPPGLNFTMKEKDSISPRSLFAPYGPTSSLNGMGKKSSSESPSDRNNASHRFSPGLSDTKGSDVYDESSDG